MNGIRCKKKDLHMNLLLTGAFKYTEKQLDKIRSLGYSLVLIQDECAPLEIDVSGIEAVVCNSLFLHNDISRFKNLKYIQFTSAGLDRVPIEYIAARGIFIKNAAGVYSIPMAEWAVLKILEICKKSRMFYEQQRRHQWEKQRDVLELAGKTAAVIGFGNVGKEAAKRLKPFGVKIIAVDNRSLNYGEKKVADMVLKPSETGKMLKKIDILILSLPLTEKTRHFLNKERLEVMKKNSIIVNVSRGGVIDQIALTEALQRGKFLGAALDVFEEEPLSESSPLWEMEKVIITPHNSFVSDKINERLFNLIMSNLSTLKREGKI